VSATHHGLVPLAIMSPRIYQVCIRNWRQTRHIRDQILSVDNAGAEAQEEIPSTINRMLDQVTARFINATGAAATTVRRCAQRKDTALSIAYAPF